MDIKFDRSLWEEVSVEWLTEEAPPQTHYITLENLNGDKRYGTILSRSPLSIRKMNGSIDDNIVFNKSCVWLVYVGKKLPRNYIAKERLV